MGDLRIRSNAVAMGLVCAVTTLAACAQDATSNGLPPLSDPLDLGEPIDVPAQVWTWVDFPDTRCMDGSSSGLGIWRNPTSGNVIINIQGGGACFNDATCLVVANQQGFDASRLQTVVDRGILSDTDVSNPFAEWNKVFIPYCSGDNFTGAADNGTGYGGRTQIGYLNIRAYLERLVPTFQDAEHVVLAGYSAGGIAATMNSVQVIEAFGDAVRVDVLNDSGTMFTEQYLSPCMQARMAERWHSGDNLPADCTECDPESGHILEPLLAWAEPRTTHVRQAYITSDADLVMRQFMGYGANDCANFDSFITPALSAEQYQEGILGIRARFADNPNFAMFQIAGTGHVWTLDSPATIESAGVTLSDWLTRFADPDAEHVSVIPQ